MTHATHGYLTICRVFSSNSGHPGIQGNSQSYKTSWCNEALTPRGVPPYLAVHHGIVAALRPGTSHALLAQPP